MSEPWLPLAAMVAALALSYLFCVRPMRNGRCVATPPRRADEPSDLARAITEARAELAQLRNRTAADPRSDGQPRTGRSTSSDR